MSQVYKPIVALWRALVDSLRNDEGNRNYRFWLLVTILFWVLPQLSVISTVVQSYPYLIQDDARHFVVWLRRFSDPGIYPNDPIAEHFLAITPWLYQALYWPFAKLGIDPLLTELLILFPAMAIAWSIVCFNFVYRLWPTAAGAAIATIALSYVMFGGQSLGLPRGVAQTSVLLLLLLFLDRRFVVMGPAVLAVWGLYPVSGLISGLAMALLMLRPRFPYVTNERPAWLTLIVAGVFSLAGASLFLISTEKAGPTITIEEARKKPNFGVGGRTEFFAASPTRFYLCHTRSGLGVACGATVIDAIVSLVAVLAVLGFGLWLTGSKRGNSLFIRFGIPPPDSQFATVMGALAISGVVLFALAHAFAFSLHLPARYAVALRLAYAFVIAICIAAGIFAIARRIIVVDRAGFATASVIGLLLLAFIVLAAEKAKTQRFRSTDAQAIHEFLRTTPKDTVVAGFPREIDSVPAFGERSVYGSLELMVPYKKNNLELISQRMKRLGPVLYAEDAAAFAQLIKDDKIDYILVNRDAAEEAVWTVRVLRWTRFAGAAAAAIAGTRGAAPTTNPRRR